MALERFLNGLLPKPKKSPETNTPPVTVTHSVQTPEEVAYLVELAKRIGTKIIMGPTFSVWRPLCWR